MTIDLRFGFKRLPEGVETAWGARWIVSQSGYVDQVWDRTDACGPDDKRRRLLGYLSDVVGDQPRMRLEYLLMGYAVDTGSDIERVLYQDDVVRVSGSPQGSHGYFYVAAYLCEEITVPKAKQFALEHAGQLVDHTGPFDPGTAVRDTESNGALAYVCGMGDTWAVVFYDDEPDTACSVGNAPGRWVAAESEGVHA